MKTGVKNFGKQAYFEIVTRRTTFRVWLNPGMARKTIATETGVTWSAVVDDFGNLFYR